MRFIQPAIVIVSLAMLTQLAGCASLAITALGVGGSAGVTHAMNGVAYRTFTMPLAKVRLATMHALRRMGIRVDSSEKQNEGELIRAATPDREIEIELEPISPQTTRVRSVAKKNAFVYDHATATEIIQQTEKFLALQQRAATAQKLFAKSK